ncbi:MAG: TatD family hydrolase [Kyrpidia sp.]|nr:TatD family hydrolase [Kyrpidia sp.]
MELFDSHSHLNDEAFAGDVAEVVARAEAAGVRTVVVPGYDLLSSERAVELAQGFDTLYAAVGIHPHEAASADDAAMDRIRELARGAGGPGNVRSRQTIITIIPQDVKVFERHRPGQELNLP